MASMVPGNQLRTLLLGNKVNKSYALVTETKTLFTVSGLVLITGIFGKVTTAITVANTVKLQANPTTGTTGNLCAATDIGTTDTPAGDVLTLSGDPTASIVLGIGTAPLFGIAKVSTDYLGSVKGIAVDTGTIEQVTTGTSPDGVINWIITYVPVDDGASLVAA